MSYVRFSADSDVYVFDDLGGYLCCCGCQLSDPRTSYYAETAAEMADHLREHEAAGHMVPAGVIDKIASTADKDDARRRRRRGQPAVTPTCRHTPGSTSRPDREDEMHDPQPTGVQVTDVAGARMLGVIADILDNTVDPSRLSTHHLAYAATVAIHRLREWGIHPGQRDADGLPVPPPHDDDCQVCESTEVHS